MIHTEVVISVARPKLCFWRALDACIRCQEVSPHFGTNDNLVLNICNNKEVTYTDVDYSHLRLCFSVDGDRLSGSCPKPYIATYFILPLHYIWSNNRLSRTGVYSEGVFSAIYVPVRRKVAAALLT